MRNRSHTVSLAALASVTAAVALPASAGAAAPGPILVQGGAGEQSQVFAVNPDGTGLKQLTHAVAGQGAENPSWSPDGSTFAFDVGQESRDDIFIARADGSHVVRLTLDAAKFHGDPAFSPDGHQISFDEYYGDGPPAPQGIFVAGADGTGSHRLTTSLKGKGAFDTESRWSPDGTRVAFTRVKSSKEAAIFTVKTDGTGLKQVTPYALDAASPNWSPDGHRIAFNTYWDQHPGKSANVYIVNADGTGMTAVTHNRGGKVNSFRPSWAPDGSKLAIAQFMPKGKAGRLDVFTINPNGTGAKRITSDEVSFAATPDWSPVKSKSRASARVASAPRGFTVEAHQTSASQKGSTISFHETLKSGHETVGHDSVKCIVKGSKLDCTGTFRLVKGTITVHGKVTQNPHNTVAITGGTGAYAGAKGIVKLADVSQKVTREQFVFS